jgi:hypothetical protein
MLKIVGTHTIDILGDGRTTVIKFNVKSMRTPSPMAEGTLPTGIGECKMTGATGATVTGVLDKSTGMVTLTFSIPPSAGKITMDFLYGRDE